MITDLTLPTRSRIAAIEFFLSRLSFGVNSARNVEVGAPSSKSESRLPHSGNVRNVISTKRNCKTAAGCWRVCVPMY
jgi:hypothetical protein